MSDLVYSAPMDQNFEPWAKYPALTKQRLSAIAVAMRDVRDQTVPLHDVAAGDNAWSLGCRIYARTLFALRRASETREWLTILPESEALRFTFAIGGVPLKFYRGDVEDAPGHCRIISEAESLARQLLLDLEGIAIEDRLLRLVVDTNAEGSTLSVTLIEMDKSGRLTGRYSIPFDADGERAISILPPGVDPGPPSIRPLASIDQDEEKKRGERNAG